MRVLCVLVVVAASAVARADAGKIVVPAVDGGKIESARAQRIEQAIKDVLTKTLGERVVLVPEKASCARDAACAKGLIEQHGADELAWFALEADGRSVAVTLEVKDAQGKVATRGREKISSSGIEEDLARLVVSKLSPSRYTGRLVIDGAPPNAQVLVDDLPIRAVDARDRTTLSVGTHRVVFVPPDRGAPSVEKEVVVPYGGQVVLTFPASAGGTAAGEPVDASPIGTAPIATAPTAVPMWPAFITGGLAAAGLATAVTIITVELFTQPESDKYVTRLNSAMNGAVIMPIKDDPAQQDWQTTGPTDGADFQAANASVAAAELATFDTATALSWATIGGGAALAVVGGLGTGALVAASLSSAAEPAGDVE